MTFDDMNNAVQEAETTLRFADRFVAKMAGLIVGRLRTGNVSSWILRDLKKELQDYNMHTNSWKDAK